MKLFAMQQKPTSTMSSGNSFTLWRLHSFMDKIETTIPAL